MIDFAYYLLKVFICSVVFFLYYRIALQGKEFHQWNRFYLLVTAVLSLLIPCLKFSILQTGQDAQGPINLVQVVSSADEYVVEISAASRQTTLSEEQWSVLLYGLICAVFALLFIHSLLKIRKLIRNHMIQESGNIKLVETTAPGTPFSFFRYIFWNPGIDLQSETGQQIMQHEIIHVQQKHSLDKMLMQTILIFFWCNPVFWLIRKELSMIHEFIADRKAVGASGAAALAAMILQASCLGALHSLTNPFFKSSIKRRLAMLTKNHDPRFRYITRILALPVLAFVGLAFTLKTKDVVNNPDAFKESVTVNATADIGIQETVLLPVSDTIPKVIFTKVDQQPKFRGGDTALRAFLHKNLRASVPVDNKAPAGTYTVICQFLVYEDGKPVDFKALTHHGYGMEAEVLRVMKLSPNWVPAVLKEQKVRTYVKQPVTFVVGKENDQQKGRPDATKNNKISEKAEGMPQFPAKKDPFMPNALLIVDGKEKETGADLNKIEPSSIASISVLKEGSALAKYGEKGKNGVIEIVTKQTTEANQDEYSSRVDVNNTIGVHRDNEIVVVGYPVKEDVKDIAPRKDNEKVVVRPPRIKDVKNTEPRLVFVKVEQPAQFPGGNQAYARFLQRELNSNVPANHKAPSGTYSVECRFIVHEDGSISDFTPLTKLGYGMEEEVVRVLKSGPKWIPAMQNGKKVATYRIQPVTFVLTKE